MDFFVIFSSTCWSPPSTYVVLSTTWKQSILARQQCIYCPLRLLLIGWWVLERSPCHEFASLNLPEWKHIGKFWHDGMKTQDTFSDPHWIINSTNCCCIPVKRFHSLFESMPRHISDVTKARGGQTCCNLLSLIYCHFNVNAKYILIKIILKFFNL